MARKIIGTVHANRHANNSAKYAITLEIDGVQAESVSAKRSDLRKRLERYGFSRDEVYAAVPLQ